MTEFEEDIAKFKKLGTAGFICDVAGFILAIAAYVFCYALTIALGILPDMPVLRIVLVVLSIIVLVLGFALEAVASLKCAQPKWQMILGMVIWLLGAVFCTIMIRMVII